jgi:hypothetical protein
MTSFPQLSFTGGEISPHIYARLDLSRYDNSVRKMRNFIAHEYGGTSNRPGTLFVGACHDHNYRSRLIPFSFNTEQSYVLEFSHNKMRIIRDGGLVTYPSGHALDGQIVEINNIYSAEELPLVKFTQSADIMTFCHPNHPVQELARTDHHEWTFTSVTFTPSLDAPSGLSATAYGGGTGTTYKYKITAVSENGEESNASQEVTCINLNNMNTSSAYYNAISWTAVTDAKKYNVYRYDDYAGYSFGFLSEVDGTSFNDNGATEPDTADAPPETRDPFSGTDNYPSCATYYKQRLCFGRSNTSPQTVWMTQTGNYKNMNVSSPTRDDDSIEYSIESNQVNDIRHIVPLKDLLVLTSGGEWSIFTDGQPVAPATISFSHESVNGSNHMPPLTINNSILYVDETSQRIRDLFYRFESDGYSGDDLTIFSHHLFEKQIMEEWAHQRAPYNIVWAIRDDGTLLGLTYNRNHNVWGWHRHDTINGQFESVCSITENGKNVLYLSVKRSINGQELRYIEKMANRFEHDLTDSIFMDSALSYNGTATSNILGLDHLEGESVSILADGNVHPRQTVLNGAISLNYDASKIHIGLPITAELQTLDVHNTQNLSIGSQRTAHQVSLSVKDTRGLWVGTNADHLIEYKQRSQSHGYDAVPAENDDITVIVPPDWTKKGRIYIQQRDPLPATILSIVPDISFADN